MPINRREFVVLPAAAVAGSVLAGQPAQPNMPWHRSRVGQVNMTEHDPISMNVEEWADYWA